MVGESFTAFGNRRNPTTWSGAATNSDLTTIAGVTREGYTFQTALGLWMGLNHMNGRVQDAVTGRFLSADPRIPDSSDSQSYNRYSYANNNPLSYSDPSGFDTTCGQVTCKPINPPPGGPDDTGGVSAGMYGSMLSSESYASYQAVGAAYDAQQAQSAPPDQSTPLDQSAPASQGNPTPQGNPSSSASAGVLVGAAGNMLEDFLAGLATQAAAAVDAGVLVLAPSTTATQDDDSGQVFYHGTSSFLGGPLDAGVAAANSNNYGSPPGFYLATDPATAVHFAAGAGNDPAVLQYYVTNTALTGLQQAGAVLGPVPGGPTSTMAFPGQQLYVPITAFPAFNGYLLNGRIILMGIHQ